MIRIQGRIASITAAMVLAIGLTAAQAKPLNAPEVQAPEHEAVPGEFIVKMKPVMSVQQVSLQSLSNTLGAHVKDTIADLNMVVIKRPAFELQSSVINTLSNNPAVEYVEPNYVYRINKTPNDPMLERLWGMNNTGLSSGTAGVDIGALQAWDIETGSDKVIVAVIDTGVNYNSPDLQGNIWVNEAELNGVAGVDDDGNGVVDDIHGANFVNANAPTGNPMDDHGHGSHCSGTIGARGDDNFGLVGVAWNTKIMGVKFLSAGGSGTLDGALKAIVYATKMGAKVLSNSWGGGGFTQSLLEAIQKSHEANTIFIAAAGNEANDNDNYATYPATYDVPNIVSVAAIDNKGQLASFSNYGKTKVHVAAPGVDVLSLTTGGYEAWSGTSMATPHVSGIAALLASHFPDMTNVEMKERIIATAKPGRFVKKKVASNGIANAYTALTNTLPEPDLNDPTYWAFAERSISTAHPYEDKGSQEWTVTVDGANEISIYFAKFRTERSYDKVQIYDAQNKLVQTISGNFDDSYSDIIQGNTARIVMTSDESVSDYGFDITKVSYR